MYTVSNQILIWISFNKNGPNGGSCTVFLCVCLLGIDTICFLLASYSTEIIESIATIIILALMHKKKQQNK